MPANALPPLAEIVIAALALGGGVFALLGAIGLVRWRDALARLHAPTLVATLGLGGAVAASVLGASLLAGAPRLHDVLVGAAVALTAPLGAHLLAKALIARRAVPAPATAAVPGTAAGTGPGGPSGAAEPPPVGPAAN